jgi:hypothetical protein
VADAGHDVLVEPTWLEFEHQGRSPREAIAALLVKIAAIIMQAEGEVLYQMDREDDDPAFEFYAIRGGHLLRQRAHLVREPAEVVTPARREAHQVA